MQPLRTRLQSVLRSRRAQLAFLSGLVVLTFLLAGLKVTAQSQAPDHTVPPQLPPIKPVANLSVTAQLSQTKWVRDADGQMYVNLSLQTPPGVAGPSASLPVDIVVVLDRSPSMLAANRFPYAKAAILALLKQLDADDRLGLIGFDRGATVYAELLAMTPAARQRVATVVQHMTVGSATNISAGLTQARVLLDQHPSRRVRKVILLSDGEANTGITDPQELAKLASDMSTHQVVLSTIGMGLGFNETLMATLADHGMGNYAYLEHLESLDAILAQELNDTQLMYAEGSELRLQLSPGVTLVNAAGYPVETIGGTPSQVRIKTGQLLWGKRKQLALTLNAATTTSGDFTVGEMNWRIRRDGGERTVSVQAEQLAYAVVEPEKRDEAVASIRPEVYRKNWLQTNFGRMREQVAHEVKSGDQRKAQAAIDSYRSQVQEAEAQSAVSISGPKLEDALEEMTFGVNDAFKGDRSDQAVKQNRLSKKMQDLSRKELRQ